MSLLFRVLVRGNIRILLPALLTGTGIYLLTDLFERLDNFIDADLGFKLILMYFVYKIPLIISQILPVVFLLATVIQLCLMIRAREMTALYAGGISPFTVLRLLLVCGFLWGGVQLGFSQWLGVSGEQQANRIWMEEVRKRNLTQTVLTNVWFTEGTWVVSLGTLNPDNTGTDLQAYRLSPDHLKVEEMVRAGTYRAQTGDWQLREAVHIRPAAFSYEAPTNMSLPLRQDLNSFRLINAKMGANPQQLSVLQLGEAIDSLYASGSNVEALRTAWHAKIAYAGSLVVMTLVAMAIVAWRDNIYLAAGLALVITFLYYAVYTVSNTLGQQGMLSPFFAAWLANLLAGLCALLKLAPALIRQKR